MSSNLTAKIRLIYRNNSAFIWIMVAVTSLCAVYIWYTIAHMPALEKPRYKCLQWSNDVGTTIVAGPDCITWLDLKTNKVIYRIGD